MPVQVRSHTQSHAAVSHQVFMSRFQPVVSAWICALQGCLSKYFTIKTCFIPTFQSCWSHKAGTTQVRAGKEFKRSLPRLLRCTLCPTDICLTVHKGRILSSKGFLVLNHHYYCNASSNFQCKLSFLKFKFQLPMPIRWGWGSINMDTGPVIKDCNTLKEGKPDCISNLRSSIF